MTAEKAAEMGCTPLAKIVGYADGATDPIDFPIAPKFALDKLMAQVFLLRLLALLMSHHSVPVQ